MQKKKSARDRMLAMMVEHVPCSLMFRNLNYTVDLAGPSNVVAAVAAAAINNLGNMNNNNNANGSVAIPFGPSSIDTNTAANGVNGGQHSPLPPPYSTIPISTAAIVTSSTATTNSTVNNPTSPHVSIVNPFTQSQSSQPLSPPLQPTISTHATTVLENVHGIVESGEVMAIMGGSGAGKTTFLDILARKNKSGIVTGEILVNGREMDLMHYRSIIGYVRRSSMDFINDNS